LADRWKRVRAGENLLGFALSSGQREEIEFMRELPFYYDYA
jgi:hypothetical protein